MDERNKTNNTTTKHTIPQKFRELVHLNFLD